MIKHNKKLLYSLLFGASMALIVACTSDSSSSDSGSSSGSDTTSNAAAIASTSEVAVGDENCPNGGVVLNWGLDTNGNGTLDTAEIQETSYICNGTDGTTGDTGTETMAEGRLKMTLKKDFAPGGSQDNPDYGNPSYLTNVNSALYLEANTNDADQSVFYVDNTDAYDVFKSSTVTTTNNTGDFSNADQLVVVNISGAFFRDGGKTWYASTSGRTNEVEAVGNVSIASDLLIAGTAGVYILDYANNKIYYAINYGVATDITGVVGAIASGVKYSVVVNNLFVEDTTASTDHVMAYCAATSCVETTTGIIADLSASGSMIIGSTGGVYAVDVTANTIAYCANATCTDVAGDVDLITSGFKFSTTVNNELYIEDENGGSSKMSFCVGGTLCVETTGDLITDLSATGSMIIANSIGVFVVDVANDKIAHCGGPSETVSSCTDRSNAIDAITDGFKYSVTNNQWCPV